MATSEVNTKADATVPHEYPADFGLVVACLGLGDGHCDFMQNVDRCRSGDQTQDLFFQKPLRGTESEAEKLIVGDALYARPTGDSSHSDASHTS
jgi:hypothetical protein